MQSEHGSGRAPKGSQLHLQRLVNDRPEFLNCLILSSSPSLRGYAVMHPKWVSPLASDCYSEYQDRAFLQAVGLSRLAPRLSAFWPRRGPVWDALATVEGSGNTQGVILLEAKSHIPELRGPGCGAVSPRSLAKIESSLAATKQAFGVSAEANWMGELYQHANRLAYLYFLNVVAQVPTWLAFLYFVGDAEQKGPSSVAEWLPALDKVKRELGLREQPLLEQRVLSVFAPV